VFAKLITFKAFAEISLEKKILSERDIAIEEEHYDEDFRGIACFKRLTWGH